MEQPFSKTKLYPRGYRFQWTNMDTGDTGAWLEASQWPDKCIHVSGTVTTFAMQGSNEAGGANPFTLTDFDGSTIVGAGGFQVRENPRYIRPVVTTGTDVQVTIEAR